MFLAKSAYQLLIAASALVSFSLLITCEGSTPTKGETGQAQEIGRFSFAPTGASLTTALLQPNERFMLKKTQINDFLPLIPAESREGVCSANSLALNVPYAWRCEVEGEIYDPCLTGADGQTVVCWDNPGNWASFKIKLSQPLPQPEVKARAKHTPRPWLVELADGVTCRLSSGNAQVNSQPITYLCSDETQLLGEPWPGEVWWAEKGLPEKNQAGWDVQSSDWTEIVAIWQTVDPGSLIEEVGLSPDQVRLDITGLAKSLQGRLVPAVAPTLEASSTLAGEPAHLRFSFDGETLSPWVNPSVERQWLIYPVAAYRQMFQEAGIVEVDQQLEALEKLLAEHPQELEQPLPLLPLLGKDGPDLTAQVKYLEFNDGIGVRFISRYTQKARPCNNEEIFYTFQGLTRDGRHYVTLFYPISTWALPDSADTLAPEETEKITTNYSTYLWQTQEKLNDLEPADFAPNLATLDAMVASLQLGLEEK